MNNSNIDSVTNNIYLSFLEDYMHHACILSFFIFLFAMAMHIIWDHKLNKFHLLFFFNRTDQC
jgi:hypothetical protein